MKAFFYVALQDSNRSPKLPQLQAMGAPEQVLTPSKQVLFRSTSSIMIIDEK
jgi:hypothetical protein